MTDEDENSNLKKRRMVGFNQPHYAPPVQDADYLAFCESMARQLGTTKDDVADHVDIAIDAEAIPEDQRTSEQQNAYLLAKKAGFL